MSSSYTDHELKQYFSNTTYRHNSGYRGPQGDGAPDGSQTSRFKGYRAFLWRKLGDERKVQAAMAVSVLAALALVGALGVVIYFTVLMGTGRTPSVDAIENPNLNLATVAYTSDGEELARYGRQNRSWVTKEEISPHVINALVATEDHRFRGHWGIDMKGIAAALADVVRKQDLRGASTITQQLARNLYNNQIGFEFSLSRKLKEMLTAIQLERRYTKDEILVMYLNTVPFRNNAYGIEAAARTYFSKPALELDVKESAVLVGMLQANTYYDPVRNPGNSQRRRNVVMGQMVNHGLLDVAYLEEHRDDPVETAFRGSDVTDSFAPYFAEHVRLWLNDWSKRSGIDVYAEGLVVYTTIDSRVQQRAQEAVAEQMKGLQAVVDYEWSRRSSYHLGQVTSVYEKQEDYEPFAYFWESQETSVNGFIRETAAFKKLRNENIGAEDALRMLKQDEAFIDSLRAEKTRLEAGLLALDPKTGYVKAWVGGRDLKVDRYDHISIAKRQPGSTFKPFVYTAAIDNGFPPSYTLRDSLFRYEDPYTGQIWSPHNSGSGVTGEWMTLAEGLARSLNTISGQLILQIDPSTAAFYARRMGIESELDEVPALALGTSDVTLLEMGAAYSTLANGGLYYGPTVVTRIEDRAGNVLYETTPAPREAISEETAFTVVDMMRDVVTQSYGTGIRIRNQFGLTGYDFAGKTGTTQNSADGWFMLMHPDLVVGSWVGFNDRRVTFRSNWWGQGAHNALFLVGDFMRRLDAEPDLRPDKRKRFPTPSDFTAPEYDPNDDPERELLERTRRRSSDDRVGW